MQEGFSSLREVPSCYSAVQYTALANRYDKIVIKNVSYGNCAVTQLTRSPSFDPGFFPFVTQMEVWRTYLCWLEENSGTIKNILRAGRTQDTPRMLCIPMAISPCSKSNNSHETERALSSRLLMQYPSSLPWMLVEQQKTHRLLIWEEGDKTSMDGYQIELKITL